MQPVSGITLKARHQSSTLLSFFLLINLKVGVRKLAAVAILTLSTCIRIFLNLQLFLSRYGYCPQASLHTFKALHGSAPTYIHKLIRPKPQSNYNLRSNTKHLLLDLPNKTKKTTGDRAFFAAAPTLWNALPDELRALDSLKTFMARLKTYYFKLAFSF